MPEKTEWFCYRYNIRAVFKSGLTLYKMGSYPSTKIQSVYSRAHPTVDWSDGLKFIIVKRLANICSAKFQIIKIHIRIWIPREILVIIIIIIKACQQCRFLWLSPLSSLPISHHCTQVLLTTSYVYTELMNVSFWYLWVHSRFVQNITQYSCTVPI